MRPAALYPRLMASHLLVAVSSLVVLGIAVNGTLERQAVDALAARLASQAQTVRASIAGTPPSDGLQTLVSRLGRASGTRFTVVRADGVVLADSERDPALMENHASREEIRDALAGRVGRTERTSETTGSPYLYVALPVADGVVVRAALPASVVGAERASIQRTLVVALVAMTALAALLSAVLARSVARPLSRIAGEVDRVARGEFSSVEPSGPREARALAAAVNRMAADLAARVEELRAETSLREQILSSMAEAVILAEEDRVVYANTAAGVLFGTPALTTLPAMVPLPDGDAPATAEFSLHHPAYREVRCATARLGGGQVLVVAQDVTEAKRLERIRRDFVANASHELKTPVAGILATAETLESVVRDDPAAAPRFAETLAKEARRLSNLVQDLLSLARLEQHADRSERVSLSRLIHEVAEAARAEAEAKTLALSVRVENDAVVAGDGADLALMIRNLLDNAIRYTPERGSVSVDVTRRDGRAVVRVADTGIGIPAKDLPRIFERFYRVDKARSRETGGTGLGLAIVRHVAESHGGTVTAESELGRGSVFTVTLPA